MNTMSVVPLFAQKSHWLSVRFSLAMGAMSLLNRTPASTLQSMERPASKDGCIVREEVLSIRIA